MQKRSSLNKKKIIKFHLLTMVLVGLTTDQVWTINLFSFNPKGTCFGDQISRVG